MTGKTRGEDLQKEPMVERGVVEAKRSAPRPRRTPTLVEPRAK